MQSLAHDVVFRQTLFLFFVFIRSDLHIKSNGKKSVILLTSSAGRYQSCFDAGFAVDRTCLFFFTLIFNAVHNEVNFPFYATEGKKSKDTLLVENACRTR